VLNVAGNRGLDAKTQAAVNDALTKAFPNAGLTLAETSNVEPFFGAAAAQRSVLALILGALFIMIYVAVRFRSMSGVSAGAMALVALLHDVIMVLVAFIIFDIPLNDSLIAVELTIIGYSINDTIVIYDRMRENQRIFGNKISLGDLINLSQNQSFTRTLNTSMNTFFSMVVVVVVSIFFGLESIRSFALPMMVGIISGCYSTLFIACPLWVMWNTRGGRNMPAQVKAAAKKGEPLKAGAEPIAVGEPAEAVNIASAPAKKASAVQKKKKKKR
jgi:preprotein translocase SecF subunit